MERTELLAPDAEGIARAASLLLSGRLVAFPTETVYGLGADAANDDAVAAIYVAKGRPATNPLILHVDSQATAERLGTFSDAARALSQAFWPGPLTLVVPIRPGAQVSSRAIQGDLVALRMPDQPLALELLRAVGRPLAAPSANPSGRISPTEAQHVLSGLNGRIAAVLDGGPTSVGLESTIVAAIDAPRVLRPGGLPAEIVEAALGTRLDRTTAGNTPAAPGQLPSHYAPHAPVRLNAEAPREGEVYLGFGPGEATLNLSAAGDLREAARQLFAHLHALDAMDRPIAVAPVPETGLGAAINDRLRRAAAPRK